MGGVEDGGGAEGGGEVGLPGGAGEEDCGGGAVVGGTALLLVEGVGGDGGPVAAAGAGDATDIVAITILNNGVLSGNSDVTLTYHTRAENFKNQTRVQNLGLKLNA